MQDIKGMKILEKTPKSYLYVQRRSILQTLNAVNMRNIKIKLNINKLSYFVDISLF